MNNTRCQMRSHLSGEKCIHPHFGLCQSAIRTRRTYILSVNFLNLLHSCQSLWPLLQHSQITCLLAGDSSLVLVPPSLQQQKHSNNSGPYYMLRHWPRCCCILRSSATESIISPIHGWGKCAPSLSALHRAGDQAYDPWQTLRLRLFTPAP